MGQEDEVGCGGSYSMITAAAAAAMKQSSSSSFDKTRRRRRGWYLPFAVSKRPLNLLFAC